MPNGDIRVKSATFGSNGTTMPSALRSSFMVRSYSSRNLGSASSTSAVWKLDASERQAGSVRPPLSVSMSVPGFGNSTTIVNAPLPYGRSTAWYEEFSA